MELVWPTWFNIAGYTEIHLATEISEEAAQKFTASCLEQTDPDEIVQILQKLDHHNFPYNARFVEGMRKHHELKLLRNENYRADLGLSDRECCNTSIIC